MAIPRKVGPSRLFREQRNGLSLQLRLFGGGRGIRTPGTLSGTAVFKTACFNRSHIPPHEPPCLILLWSRAMPTIRGGLLRTGGGEPPGPARFWEPTKKGREQGSRPRYHERARS